jgi:Predicted nucleoside-diphosphate sugar epimerase
MKITITGSSGYLGREIIRFLEKNKFTVNSMTRKKDNSCFWDPENKNINNEIIDNSDVIINLNGAKIIQPFRRKKLSKIISSRIKPTRLLFETIKKSNTPPKLIISASATGFYGNRPNEIIDEKSPKGRGLIPDIAEEWEQNIKLNNTRVVYLRLGTVIDENSDIYLYMKKYGRIIGVDRIGNGLNYFPWISNLDVCRSIVHVINKSEISGPVNIVSNNPIYFKDVMESLNKKINPLVKLPLPAATINMIFGKLGEEILLSNQRILPTKLKESGFTWLKTSPFGSIT